MKITAKVKHWFRKLTHGVEWTDWLPGEPPPPPLTGDMMEKAYRTMVDNGVIKYGEPVFVETYNKETEGEA